MSTEKASVVASLPHVHTPPVQRATSSGSWQTAWNPNAHVINPLLTGSREVVDATWDKFAKRLQRQDEYSAKVWKEEIDALLVFAGLFSAVLTAFNVDTYKSLKPCTPAASDTNTLALIHLITLLNNGTTPEMLAAATVSDNCNPGSAAVWINALWFASLVLSLSSASIGIVIRQWLNYFTSATPTTGKQDVYIYCLRWDKGIISWRVPELMAILPILLQLALTLFFIGLVILLWTLNNSVAIVTTVFVSAVLAFLVFSTVVPAWSPYCPYKSPQALLVHTTAHWVMRRIDSIWKTLAAISANAAESWVVREIRWLRDGLTRFSGFTQELHRRPETLYRNWASLEQAVVKPVEGDNPHHKTMSWIEDHIFACGHVLLMDEVLLSEVIPTCLMDFNEAFAEDTAARHDG